MGGSGNMIPADANNKMGAYKFISWLVSKDGTTRARELTGNNYANKEAYNDPDFAQMSDPSFGDQKSGRNSLCGSDAYNQSASCFRV